MKQIYLDIDGIITIFNIGEEERLLEFKESDFEKGYVYDSEILYLFPISDLIGGTINLFFYEKPSIDKKRIIKGYKVPFEVKNEGIIIAGQSLKEKVLLENGKYEVHFYIYKEIQEENHYDLYFIKSKKPKYKLLIKQKKEKLKIIETINSKERTKEEAIQNFDFNFKLPNYFPIQNEPNANGVSWQKFIMSDGSVQGLIQREFFNQSDKSFFKFRIGKGTLGINTKDWSETIISEQKIYFIEEEYKPFLYVDNGEFVYDDGKAITFVWKENKLSYSCSFGVTKDLNLVEEMKKVFNSLELINEKHK